MNAVTQISVIVNETPIQIPEQTSVAELVAARGLHQRAIAVELNFELIAQAQMAATRLHDGDRIEIVTLAGGG